MLLERNLMSIYVSVSLRPSDGDVAFASLRPRILSSIPIIFAVHTHTYTRIQYRYCVYWCVLRSSRAFRIFSKFDVSSSLRAQPNSHKHRARQPVLHRECALGCLQQQSCETRALITNSWTLSVRLPLSTPSHGEKLHRARPVKSYRIAWQQHPYSYIHLYLRIALLPFGVKTNIKTLVMLCSSGVFIFAAAASTFSRYPFVHRADCKLLILGKAVSISRLCNSWYKLI